MDTKRERGDRGEAIAEAYLRNLGWRIVARNVLYRVGELDVVAEDDDHLVFVEVRSRSGSSGPPPSQTVTFPKQRRLTRAANLFLARYRGPHRNARFDVIGVDLRQQRILTHIRGAFDAAAY